MKHHKYLNQCIHNAIGYDDNCGEELKGKDISSKTSASTSLVASQVEEITKGVIEKIQHLYGMPKLMDPQRLLFSFFIFEVNISVNISPL